MTGRGGVVEEQGKDMRGDGREQTEGEGHLELSFSW